MASSSSGAETKELSVNNGSAISLGPTTPVNLFLEPHNRMKELVSWPLTEAAKVSDVHELEPSLQAIYEAMWEMKTHEYIENHYIMDQLKQRLQSRRVSKNRNPFTISARGTIIAMPSMASMIKEIIVEPLFLRNCSAIFSETQLGTM